MIVIKDSVPTVTIEEMLRIISRRTSIIVTNDNEQHLMAPQTTIARIAPYAHAVFQEEGFSRSISTRTLGHVRDFNESCKRFGILEPPMSLTGESVIPPPLSRTRTRSASLAECGEGNGEDATVSGLLLDDFERPRSVKSESTKAPRRCAPLHRLPGIEVVPAPPLAVENVASADVFSSLRTADTASFDDAQAMGTDGQQLDHMVVLKKARRFRKRATMDAATAAEAAAAAAQDDFGLGADALGYMRDPSHHTVAEYKSFMAFDAREKAREVAAQESANLADEYANMEAFGQADGSEAYAVCGYSHPHQPQQAAASYDVFDKLQYQ